MTSVEPSLSIINNTPGPHAAASSPVRARHASDPETSIRIGILLDDEVQEAWVLCALQKALAAPGAECVGIVVARTATRQGIVAGLHRAVDFIDRSLRCERDPLLERVDVAAALGGDPPREMPLLRPGDQWLAGPEGIAVLRDARADVWLCCSAAAPQSPFPWVCPLGVWGLEIGARVPAGSRWAGASEVGRGSALTVAQVVDYAQPGRNVLYRGSGMTVRNSAGRNRLVALHKASGFFARLLRTVNRDAGSSTQPLTAEPLPHGVSTEASLAGVIRLCWRLVAEVASNRLRRLCWRDQWRIGYYFADGDSDAAYVASHLRRLIPPRDREWADPFIARHDGRTFIFFEELPYKARRAHISAVEIFDNGEAGQPQRVLERPYHLSYPQVFAWGGELFMLPETGENRTVELYRCERFPDRWSLHKVLLEGIRAYDATLLREGGRWWMFVNIAEGGADPNEELHLYWSELPLGPWMAHPSNPVISDIRRARGAGPLFRRDGVLYRPSQDCSTAYGSAVAINRIDVLDTEHYQETPVGRMDPDRKAGMRCLHTFGTLGRLRVLDFIVRRPRWSHR